MSLKWGGPVLFEWDERKREINLRKHRLDSRSCAEVFRGPRITWLDVRFDYGEPRFRSYGLLKGYVVVVVFLETPAAVRIISMRKATHREETFFFQNIQD
jgi:uncharacterized DUF497 family protein